MASHVGRRLRIRRFAMFKNMKIRKKLLISILCVALGVLVVVYAGVLALAVRISRYLGDMYDEISDRSIATASDGLLAQARSSLNTIAQVQTEATDNALQMIVAAVDQSADYMEHLYADSGSYRTTPYAVYQKTPNPIREMVGQYMLCDGAEMTEARAQELTLLTYSEPIFKSYLRSGPIFDGFYIGTESDIYYAYSADQDYASDYVAKQRPWYQLAMEHPGEVVWMDTYTDPFGDVYITASRTIAGPDGSPVAVVGVDVFLTTVAEKVLADGLGASGNSFLLGTDGELIAYHISAGEEFNGSFDAHFENPDTVRAELAKGEGNAFFAVFDGKEVYMTSSAVPTTGWTFCTAIDKAEIFSITDRVTAETGQLLDEKSAELKSRIGVLIGGLLVSLIVLALLTGIVAHLLARSITNPIRRLERQVIQVGDGDFDTKILPESRDEIGQLALRFGEMQDSLKRYMDNLRSVTAEKERIGAELNVATQIQADMLPRIFPPFPEKKNIMLYASMQPAKEVGGDFYDFFLLDPDHLAFVIADVSGKGVPAALFMVISKTLLKNRAMQGGSPAEILHDVNNQLCEGNEAEMFVTCWLAICDLSTGRIVAANAGHEYPAVCGPDRHFELLKDRHGFVLGGMRDVRYRDYEITLERNGGFFVYTDGVPEATNSENQLFGVDRLLEALNEQKPFHPKDLLEHVGASAMAFAGAAPQFDDMTMVGFIWLGSDGDDTMTEEGQELVLDAKTGELEKLNAFLERAAEENDCSMKTLLQLQVAAEEIFTNIASYAYPEGGGKVWIRLSTVPAEDGGKMLRLSFTDAGVAFDPLAQPDPDVKAAAEDRRIGGLGIFMVKKSMDQVAYSRENGKNILTLYKKLG